MFFYNIKQIVIITTIMSLANVAYSQDELLNEADSVLDSEQIDVDGEWNEAVDEKTPQELLEDARRKSELKNVKMITKEIENLKVPARQVKKIKQDEKKDLQSRIANVFGNGTDSKEDKVKVVQAAPVKVEATVSSKKFGENQFKITPMAGLVHIQGDDNAYESKLAFSLTGESMIGSRFSFGVGVNYASMNLKDPHHQYNNNNYNLNQYNYMNSSYRSVFGNEGRELSYAHFTLEMNSKVFILTSSRVRPYFGVAVGYNRTGLTFKDQQEYVDHQYGITYGAEEFNSSYFSGKAMLGTEISFTDNIGAVLEASYSKGLGAGFDYESKLAIENRDQQRLNELGKELENADFLSIMGGVQASF